MRSLTTPVTKWLILAASFALAATAADLKLKGDRFEPEYFQVSIRSAAAEKDFKEALAQLMNKANWQLLEQKSAASGANPAVFRAVTVIEAKVDVDDQTIKLIYDPTTLPVLDAAEIPNGHLKVQFNGQDLQILTGVKAKNTPAALSLDSCFTMKLTKDKKNADIDITGGLLAGVGAKPQYNWSVKASCRIVGNQLLHYGELGPTFTGEATQQQNADPDSLKAGLTWKKMKAREGRNDGFKFTADLLSYEFERKVKTEPVLEDGKPVDREYLQKNANLMWSGKVGYITGWRPINTTLTGGFEAGRSLSRSVKKDSRSDKEQPVARLYFSADLYRTLFARKKAILVLHGNHIIRVPFEPEPYKEAGVNGGKMFLTNKPRHYSLIEMLLPVADGLGVNVQYKRGSIPPTFAFVDHQVTIGFNLLLKRP